ncbi:hypothetical protein [Iodidimonas sp. SYSU 1G8]|uniref:hypothetical protein n=1 Tax=Iodidimonas sp. SYSU 1G8 TaxID=3133967 RepID=UPI0031FF443D
MSVCLRLFFLIVLSGLVASGGSRAEPAAGWHGPDLRKELPFVTEMVAGGNVLKAELVAEPWHTEAPRQRQCMGGDGVTLTVSRDGAPVGTDAYCSAYGSGWAEFQIDARGTPYLFVAYQEGRGTRATATYMRVYTLQPAFTRLTQFDIRVPMTELGDVAYEYRVSAPPEGGLIVDRKAAEWPEDEICCDEEGMVRSDQIVIPPAR